MNSFQRLGELQEHIDNAGNLDANAKVLDIIKTIYGFKNVAYLGVNLPKITSVEPYVINTYRDEWAELYREKDYVLFDPVIHQSIKSIMPVDWVDMHDGTKKIESFFAESKLFGVGNHGVTIPIRGRWGELALFSLSIDESDGAWELLVNEFLLEFNMIAYHIHEMTMRTHNLGVADVHLSPREIEVLKWTANGKTVLDVAEILGITPHTVSHYIECARFRLTALNKSHAVARALALSLIPPPD